jgi:uncharacterized protein (TIGR02594 family)
MKSPPWLELSYKELNTREIRGPEANPKIVDYFKYCSYKSTSDETPWCSAFACAMMERSGIPSPKSARARDWQKWGLRILKPVQGCVVVLKRGDNPEQGHVGFYVYETENTIALLAGNQSNQVGIQEFSKFDVLDFRIPDPEYWRPGGRDDSDDSSYS